MKLASVGRKLETGQDRVLGLGGHLILPEPGHVLVAPRVPVLGIVDDPAANLTAVNHVMDDVGTGRPFADALYLIAFEFLLEALEQVDLGAFAQFIGRLPFELSGQVFQLAGEPLSFFEVPSIDRIHGVLLFSFDHIGLVLEPLGHNPPLFRQEGVILAQGGPGLLFGYCEPFVHCLLQRCVRRLHRGDLFPDSGFPLGPLPRQFLPDVRRQPLGLVALSCFNPMPNRIASVGRDRLVAVGTLGRRRVRMNWRLSLQ
jgi:hypothetical protein